jgi:multisubunit Na+/H+ antiporter MnhG subunit
MFDIFTKPSGEETTKGKLLGFLAGIIVGSGFYALSTSMQLFSPAMSAILAVFFLVITTYQVRQKLAKKEEPKEEAPEETQEEEQT